MGDIFETATKVVFEYWTSNPNAMAKDVALNLYGLYKQGTAGDITIDRPEEAGEAQDRWEAWNSKKGVAEDEAKAAYVESARNNLPEDYAARIAQLN